MEIAATNLQLLFLQANKYPTRAWSLYSVTQSLKQYPHTSLHLCEALTGHFEQILCRVPWSPWRKASRLLHKAHVRSAIGIKWLYFLRELALESAKFPHVMLSPKKKAARWDESFLVSALFKTWVSFHWAGSGKYDLFLFPTIKWLFPLVSPQNAAVHPKMRLIHLRHFNK